MTSCLEDMSIGELKAECIRNADYDTDCSPEKAKRFIAAARALLIKTTEQGSHGSASNRVDTAKYEREISRAKVWLRSRSAGRLTQVAASTSNYDEPVDRRPYS